ncbi:MAG: peptide ABC transporter substrate-binding protein [Gemmatimonadaceae bacterium]|nr:peptide ABC transporter substrate-binding protein [Gemmatimonadaceae bacterium]MCW5825927.1 peptide ABC transporter substrate-binding protein [Gemmatimonadaceae bacterium]
MRRLSCLVALALAACGGDSSSGPLGGTVVIAAAADADALLPPLVRTSQGRLASELLFDRLAEIGPSLNTVGDADFRPRLASRWSWSADSLSITFTLHPDARWHDGRAVTAADVEAGYRLFADSSIGSSVRANIADVSNVAAVDQRTVRISWTRRSPEQFYAASLIVPMPAHLLPTDGTPLATSALARQPVGSGAFRFVVWQPLERLELVAFDDYYRERARLDRVVLSVSPEPATGLAKIWTEQADVWELVPAGDIAEAQRYPHVRLQMGRAFDYAYAAFNLRDARDRSRPHPLFADRNLRRAISFAVDREQVVKAIFDTLAYVSQAPAVHAQDVFDSTMRALPFDRARAAALLDSLGWRVDARDGIRRRDGRRLAFTALVPGSSRNREQAAVRIQEQLRQVGVAMDVERAENQTFTQKRQQGRFDLVFGGWLTTPSASGIRSTWGSSSRPGWGSLNDGRYESADFDAAVEAGLNAMDRATAKAELARAYRILAEDAAAMFLYEPRTVAAVHRRLNVPAWRADGWWRNLHEWSVDPAQPLPRDARTTP